MIDFDAAIELVEQTVALLGTERIPFGEAAERTLAEDLRARDPSPRHAVSAMDGYAVIAATTAPNRALRVVGESRAGAGFEGVLGEGEAVRIFTGARLPEAADCVVMQEYATRAGDMVRFEPGYGPATHVRAAASDFAAGDLLVPAGTRLRAGAMIAAAAADRAEIAVARRPRVAILATGDELVAPGSAHGSPDAIPESVTHGVAAMIAEAGGAVVLRLTGVDELPELEALAGSALASADLVVVTGGASVGERDLAKPAFAAHGFEPVFEKVAIKPGKPVWFGKARGTFVLGLPGNPTSALVTATLFLRPILARLQGASGRHTWRRLPLAAALRATGDRETFARARWEAEGLAPASIQDSGAQSPLVSAGWLIRCPPMHPALAVGSTVNAIQL